MSAVPIAGRAKSASLLSYNEAKQRSKMALGTLLLCVFLLADGCKFETISL
jgi:hypothetical protein